MTDVTNHVTTGSQSTHAKNHLPFGLRSSPNWSIDTFVVASHKTSMMYCNLGLTKNMVKVTVGYWIGKLENYTYASVHLLRFYSSL